MGPAATDQEIVEQAHALALDFHCAAYPGAALAPSAKLYDMPAYPCWGMACHAYEKLLGVDVREALSNLKGKS